MSRQHLAFLSLDSLCKSLLLGATCKHVKRPCSYQISQKFLPVYSYISEMCAEMRSAPSASNPQLDTCTARAVQPFLHGAMTLLHSFVKPPYNLTRLALGAAFDAARDTDLSATGPRKITSFFAQPPTAYGTAAQDSDSGLHPTLSRGGRVSPAAEAQQPQRSGSHHSQGPPLLALQGHCSSGEPEHATSGTLCCSAGTNLQTVGSSPSARASARAGTAGHMLSGQPQDMTGCLPAASHGTWPINASCPSLGEVCMQDQPGQGNAAYMAAEGAPFGVPALAQRKLAATQSTQGAATEQVLQETGPGVGPHARGAMADNTARGAVTGNGAEAPMATSEAGRPRTASITGNMATSQTPLAGLGNQGVESTNAATLSTGLGTPQTLTVLIGATGPVVASPAGFHPGASASEPSYICSDPEQTNPDGASLSAAAAQRPDQLSQAHAAASSAASRQPTGSAGDAPDSAAFPAVSAQPDAPQALAFSPPVEGPHPVQPGQTRAANAAARSAAAGQPAQCMPSALNTAVQLSASTMPDGCRPGAAAAGLMPHAGSKVGAELLRLQSLFAGGRPAFGPAQLANAGGLGKGPGATRSSSHSQEARDLELAARLQEEECLRVRPAPLARVHSLSQ